MASLYDQVSEQIRKLISSGEYSTGEPFDSEISLQKKFGVSRTTIRKAVDSLVNEGILTRRNGVGLFITPKFNQKNILEMSGILKREELESRKQKVRNSYLRIAGKYYSKILDTKENSLLYYVDYTDTNNHSITQEKLFLPLDNYPGFDLASISVGSVLDITNSGNKAVTTMEQNMELILPEREQQKVLKIDEFTPIFKFHNLFTGSENEPICLEIRYEDATNTNYAIDFD